MEIDESRLWTDIEENGQFGAIDTAEGHGRTVLTGTEPNRRARDRLVDRLKSAGMDVFIDSVGNIEGRWVPSGVDPSTAPVVAGSHLDSVPRGGIFDGPLGVYGALEAVRSIQENGPEVDRPLSVVSFTCEEGTRFGSGLLGSSAVSGVREVSDILALEDGDGCSVAEALESIGYAGDDEIEPQEWHAWVELHVEQDSTLEHADVPVGIVERITGITNLAVEVVGEANHAGSTSMPDRTDALAAASELVLEVEAAANHEHAHRCAGAVGTIGDVDISPNEKSIVPGHFEALVDIRAVEYGSMNRLVEVVRDVLRRLEEDRGVDTSFERYRDQEPSHMSENAITAAIQGAQRAGADYKRMDSAAVHDTANIARETDAVLLFAPSRDGISHSPREWTDWADCATATSILAETMVTLATE